MSTLLTDTEIASLIAEPKELGLGYMSKLQLRSKQGHRERELEITGNNGSLFKIILRQSNLNVFDFSAILAYCPPDSTQVIRLRRYNGKSHEHTNKLERETFYGFHIHYATQRYQQSGLREDAYAQTTSRYAGFDDALNCLIADCAIVLPPNDQPFLF